MIEGLSNTLVDCAYGVGRIARVQPINPADIVPQRLISSLSQTLRARDNGAADCHPPVAWRFAPHNQRMKPTSAVKAFSFWFNEVSREGHKM